MTNASFRDSACSFKLARLKDHRVNSRIGNKGLMRGVVVDIAYLSKESGSCGISDTVYTLVFGWNPLGAMKWTHLPGKRCMAACPYGAPQYDAQKKKVDKCNLCYHRLKEGLPPACVRTCLEYLARQDVGYRGARVSACNISAAADRKAAWVCRSESYETVGAFFGEQINNEGEGRMPSIPAG